MLIRFVLRNFFSFGEQQEFNMLPKPRLRALDFHKYSFEGVELLKMSSIYGANGAGKSNLIKALAIFQNIVIDETLPANIKQTQFKFQKNDTSQLLAVEFIEQDEAFYYAIELLNGKISTEELYLSSLNKKEDKLIYERKTNENGIIELTFSDAFENDTESKVLKSVLVKSLIKPNKPILKLIAENGNEFTKGTKKVFNWFQNGLFIITPNTRPLALVHALDIDYSFQKYAKELICSLNIGIKSLRLERSSLEDFFIDVDENELGRIKKSIEESPKKMGRIRLGDGSEVAVVKEKGDYFIKELILEHEGKDGIIAEFDIEEESDGTIRLLDFMPIFRHAGVDDVTFIIDEIERSIHPLLIKELVQKFSLDEQSKGQLIFTTHESNLLDQSIFRQDEIWFAEKDNTGSTNLYSLSDFKEHHTIDIRKGYLNGRYGSIPFLGNLHDLNWHKEKDVVE